VSLLHDTTSPVGVLACVTEIDRAWAEQFTYYFTTTLENQINHHHH
jgi:hypothetical protein